MERKNILSTKRKRNYGIDILRILSILFIINHHIIYHGGPLSKTKKNSLEFQIFLYLNIICITGVNSFGMISGFVGFHSYKYSNLLYLLLTTFFYSFGIAIVFRLYFSKLINIDLKKFLFPIFITDYWYFNCYFLMYFFFPLINKGILGMNRNEMKFFIINIFLIFSLVGEIRHYIEIFKSKDILFLRNGFSYSWLIILYLYGSYFGKFKQSIKEQKKYIFNFILLIIILIVSIIRAKILLYKYKIYHSGCGMNVDYTSPSSVIISICFINIFNNLEINNSFLIKIISFFAPLTFGVYLIHNHLLIRNHIVRKYFLWLLNYNSYKLISLEIIISFIIFLICSLIDYLRYILFKLFRIRELCIKVENTFKLIGNKIIFNSI